MDNGIIMQLIMLFFCPSLKWLVEGYTTYLKSHINTILLQATILHRRNTTIERPQLMRSNRNQNIDALIKLVLMYIENFRATLENDIIYFK